VSAGCKLNVQDHVGDTPAHKAAWKGAKEVIEVLVAAGCDLTIKNAEGRTAKDVAKDPSISTLLFPVSQKLWEDDELEEEPNPEEEED